MDGDELSFAPSAPEINVLWATFVIPNFLYGIIIFPFTDHHRRGALRSSA